MQIIFSLVLFYTPNTEKRLNFLSKDFCESKKPSSKNVFSRFENNQNLLQFKELLKMLFARLVYIFQPY